MSDTVISIENVSKLYRLGQVGTGTLSHDLNRWWHRVRGKEDPYAKVGQTNDRSRKGGSENGYAWALRDVNLKVKQGEILGIIGRNGAGKSTLLKIMSRVTSPTTGHVRIKGRIAALLEVGTGFHPELTGRENIYLNGAILGMRRHEISRKLSEIVDFSGCSAYMDTPVKRYSSGMFVRLAFAVAAHLDPEILVVDEVLAVGDSEFQKRCLAKMDEVSHSQGRTILFVSHQLGVVSALCKTGLLLKDGEVALAGDISSVLQAYLAQSNQTSGEVSWEPDKAPQSPHVRLTRLRITSEGKVCDCVPISQEVQLELEYEVLEAGPTFNVSFHLLDPMGNCILATANLASASHTPDKLSGTKLSPGRYLSQCLIPAHFLNDTSYKVSAFVVTNFAHIEAQAIECVGFTGHDDGSMRQEFSGAWIGQIRPRLDWRTERI